MSVRKRYKSTTPNGPIEATNPNYNPTSIGVPTPSHNYGPSTFWENNPHGLIKKPKIMPPDLDRQYTNGYTATMALLNQYANLLPSTSTRKRKTPNENTLFKGAYTTQNDLEDAIQKILKDKNPGFILTIQGDNQQDNEERYKIELGPDGNKKWKTLGGKRRTVRKKHSKRTVRKQRK